MVTIHDDPTKSYTTAFYFLTVPSSHLRTGVLSLFFEVKSVSAEGVV